METIYVYGILAVAVYIGSGLLLVLILRKHEMLVKRQLPLVVFKTVLLFIILSYYILSVLRFYFFDDSLEYDFFPCYGRLIVDYVASTVWMISFILRAAHLFAIYKFQHLKLNAATNKTQISHTNTSEEHQSLAPQKQETNESSKKECPSTKIMDVLSLHVLNMLFAMLSLSSTIFYKLFGLNASQRSTQTVSRLDIPIMLLWVALLNVVIIILIIVVDWKCLGLDPWQSGCYPGDMIVIYCLIVGFILLVPPFLVALYNVKDTLYIRVELTSSICIFTLAFIVYLSDAFLSKPYMSRYLPLAIAASMIHILSTFFPCFIQIYRITRKLEPNCTVEYLDTIIANPNSRKRLLRLAAKQLVVENVYFLIDYGSKLNEMDASKSASGLFEKYLDSQAPYELNLPFNVKSPIVKAKEKGDLRLEHFDKVCQHVKGLLVANTLQSFINREKRRRHSHIDS